MLNPSIPKIILGSSSPRRRELLGGMGFQFEIIKPEFDEVQLPGEDPEVYVRRNSHSKAAWVLEEIVARSGEHLVICADTIVVLNGKVYEKPTDENVACRMLGELQGQTHTVFTALTVARTGGQKKIVTKLVRTAVTLSPMTPEKIISYVRSGEPMDKAGSYAIQGLGGFMVRAINGSYSNVVGLPLAELIDTLEQDFALPLWSSPKP